MIDLVSTYIWLRVPKESSNISHMNWTVGVDQGGTKRVTSTLMSLLDELHYTQALVGVEDVWYTGGRRL